MAKRAGSKGRAEELLQALSSGEAEPSVPDAKRPGQSSAVPEGAEAPGFADNFDRLLGIHRLSAREAGELLGISATTLSYWRNGRRIPNTESLRRVCEFFDVDMWSMLVEAPESFLFDVDRFKRVEARLRPLAEARLTLARSSGSN